MGLKIKGERRTWQCGFRALPNPNSWEITWDAWQTQKAAGFALCPHWATSIESQATGSSNWNMLIYTLMLWYFKLPQTVTVYKTLQKPSPPQVLLIFRQKSQTSVLIPISWMKTHSSVRSKLNSWGQLSQERGFTHMHPTPALSTQENLWFIKFCDGFTHKWQV